MKKQILTTLLAMPLAISHAWAADEASSFQPTVKISGYGTGAMTWTDTDQAQFGRPNQSTGATKTGRTGVDSNLGLQANVGLTNWLSGTVQGLVRKDAEDDYGAELSWAFLKAKVSDNFSVRVGRVGIPAFMISDYRNVGYANTFLRAPNEVYSQMPFTDIDGIDGTYQRSYGDTTLTLQLALGRSKKSIAGSGGAVVHLKGSSLSALNVVAENGPFTLRFGRVDGKLTLDDFASQNTLIAGLRNAAALVPSLNQLADQAIVSRKDASFTSLGLGLDWNQVIGQAEVAKRKTDSYLNDSTSWYVLGGYRFGKILPYYIHANLKNDGSIVNTVPALPALAALRAGVTQISNGAEQTTDSIGVRWDFASSAALKVQLDRVRPKNGNGLFVHVQPGFNGPVTVVAAGIDFVF